MPLFLWLEKCESWSEDSCLTLGFPREIKVENKAPNWQANNLATVVCQLTKYYLNTTTNTPLRQGTGAHSWLFAKCMWFHTLYWLLCWYTSLYLCYNTLCNYTIVVYLRPWKDKCTVTLFSTTALTNCWWQIHHLKWV